MLFYSNSQKRGQTVIDIILIDNILIRTKLTKNFKKYLYFLNYFLDYFFSLDYEFTLHFTLM